MLSLPCPLDRVLSVVLDHVAESGLKSLFDPPSLDPFLSMLLGCSIESGCWPPCPYRSKLISMLLGPGTETEVKPGHVSKAPTLTAFFYLPPSMVLGHSTAATAGLKSGCVPLDPLVSLVLGSGTETEVKPWAWVQSPPCPTSTL